MQETLDAADGKEFLQKVNAEWDAATKCTVIHEHKLLEDRKAKLEIKPISFSEVIDPRNRSNLRPVSTTEPSTSNTQPTRGGILEERDREEAEEEEAEEERPRNQNPPIPQRQEVITTSIFMNSK